MEITEQEFWDSIMSEQCEVMRKYDEECKRKNARTLKAIGNQLGQGYLKDLLELIEDSEVFDIYWLVDEPSGKFQQETDFGCIVGIWVLQYTDGEDSYHGRIWIKLKQGLYLELKFAS